MNINHLLASFGIETPSYESINGLHRFLCFSYGIFKDVIKGVERVIHSVTSFLVRDPNSTFRFFFSVYKTLLVLRHHAVVSFCLVVYVLWQVSGITLAIFLDFVTLMKEGLHLTGIYATWKSKFNK